MKSNLMPILYFKIAKQSRFHFVHSFHFKVLDAKNILATTNYSELITAAVIKDNIFGTQFHPEKSHSNGIKLLEKFSTVESIMIVYPAIDLKNGKRVRLIQGDF